MNSNENAKEFAKKHLVDCEKMVAKQLSRIDDLKSCDLDTKDAEKVLEIMKLITSFAREDYALFQLKVT